MLLYLLKEIYWLNHLFTWGSFALYVVKIVELYVSTIGLLNITEPAPVDGANEASISGDENNASSTNNASCASVWASNKILIYLFLAGCKQNSSAS